MNAPKFPEVPGYWKVISLLLGTARKRAAGRRKRAQELMRRRAKNPKTGLYGLTTFASLFVGFLISGAAAYVVHTAVSAGGRVEAELGGSLVVDGYFKERVGETLAAREKYEAALHAFETGEASRRLHGATASSTPSGKRSFDLSLPLTPEATPSPTAPPAPRTEETLEGLYGREAHRTTERYGGNEAALKNALRAEVTHHGTHNLLVNDKVTRGLGVPHGLHSMPSLLGSLVLLWWAAALVFQREGMEMDLQRRRHPMWEWLSSHPVPLGAIFAAEILSPLAANPIYWGVPLFVGIVYAMTYDALLGMSAAWIVGVPLMVAAACLGRAFEIGIMIRCSPRSRGALIGLMSWFGYASLMLVLLGAASFGKIAGNLGRVLAPLRTLP